MKKWKCINIILPVIVLISLGGCCRNCPPAEAKETRNCFEEHTVQNYQPFLQYQNQSNWCWVATSRTFINYTDPNKHFSQSDLYDLVKNTHCGAYDVCGNPLDNNHACNKTSNVAPVLDLLANNNHIQQNYSTKRKQDCALTFDFIKNAIDNNSMIVFAKPGLVHYELIVGYKKDLCNAQHEIIIFNPQGYSGNACKVIETNNEKFSSFDAPEIIIYKNKHFVSN